MAETVLRLYVPGVDEFGADGYPLVWHKLDNGIPEHEAAMNEADMLLPGGVKDVIRALVGHRCVRCGHPFRVGRSSAEWSPCDQRCAHAGPCRGNPWPAIESSPWREIAFTERWPTAGEWAVRMPVEAAYRVLTVHHLNGVKADLRWWNLASLCQRCHLTIQGKVVLDRVWPHEHSQWFRPYAAGWYAHRYLGEDLTREQVTERLDELLALEIRQLSLEGTHA